MKRQIEEPEMANGPSKKARVDDVEVTKQNLDTNKAKEEQSAEKGDPMKVDTTAKLDTVEKAPSLEPHILHIWEEHINTRNLYNKVLDEKNMETKQALFNELVKQICQHETAEEVVIQPAFSSLTKDDAMVAKAREQETEFARVLKELDDQYGKKMDATIDVKLKECLPALLAHMEMEETKILKALENGLSKEDLEGLNTWFDRVKMAAPSRPHPDAPKDAIGSLATAPLLTLFDKIRDLSKTFPSS
jgi:hemerythrin superfamily protein